MIKTSQSWPVIVYCISWKISSCAYIQNQHRHMRLFFSRRLFLNSLTPLSPSLGWKSHISGTIWPTKMVHLSKCRWFHMLLVYAPIFQLQWSASPICAYFWWALIIRPLANRGLLMFQLFSHFDVKSRFQGCGFVVKWAISVQSWGMSVSLAQCEGPTTFACHMDQNVPKTSGPRPVGLQYPAHMSYSMPDMRRNGLT